LKSESAPANNDVFEITGGGNFADAPFATIINAAGGAAFGLAIDQDTNRILAPAGHLTEMTNIIILVIMIYDPWAP
jgi:hypothetical protein